VNPDAKTGFEKGERVLVTPFDFAAVDAIAEPQREPDKRELAFEMLIQAMRGIVTKRGHHASDRTEIAALLVLTGTETVESAAAAIGKDQSAVAKAIARAKKELQQFSASKTLENKGESPEKAG
jgi:catalase (peroxidase I)